MLLGRIILILSQIQSTFMNDLQEVSLALKQVTSRSLLLIDEFGKGTLRMVSRIGPCFRQVQAKDPGFLT